MDDLISRQAAIDALWKAMYEYEDKMEKQFSESDDLDIEDWIQHRIFVQNMGDIDRKTILDLPSAQPEQRWIPCSERLPFAECGESDNVLATCGYRGVEDTSIRWIRTLYFDGDCWCCPTGGTYDQRVYAWMPLPEPWRGDSICK